LTVDDPLPKFQDTSFYFPFSSSALSLADAESIMSHEYRSVKWISSGKGKALNVHKVQAIFGPVEKNPCNLISIFGRARQGKSFLMNCLAGEREIFRISNEKESCTQGIDISNKWLNLSEFSKMDRGKAVSGRAEGIKVGFVDAEGQGDKDVSYDANLICPILLTSKCVIFNWKGDLQKDHILSTLGIMARAAQNITTETASSSGKGATSNHDGAKFGHLHIIFRDWQAVKTDEAAVFETLMGIEGTTESATRDLIRSDLLASFASIRVWLFDPPSEYTRDLKQKLTFDKTSAAFRGQVRALREALAQQLREPTYVAGHALTGRAYGPLTEQIATALNAGGVVLPSSAYLAMMRQEAIQLQQQYDADLREQMQQLLEDINQPFAATAGKTSTQNLYPTRTEAEERFAELEVSVGAAYESRIRDITGNVAPAPGTPVAVILSEHTAQVEAINAGVRQQFLALYAQLFQQWLLRARRSAEKLLDFEVGLLERKLPLEDPDTASPLNLENQLQGVLAAGLRLIGGAEHYGEDCAEAVDAEEVLRRHCASLSARVTEKNDKLLEQRHAEAQEMLQAALAEIEQALDAAVAKKTAAKPQGYHLSELEVALNAEYFKLNERLAQQLPRSSRDAILAQFTKCGALRGRLVQRYDDAKEAALQQALRQARHDTSAALKGVDVPLLWQGIPLEDCGAVLDVVLTELAARIESSVTEGRVAGWLLERTPDASEKRFLAELHAAVHDPVREFRAEWEQELDRLIEEEEEAHNRMDETEDDGPVPMDLPEGKESDEEEDEEEEEHSVQRGVRGVQLSGAKKASSSTEEQRRRAMEWARQNGMDPTATKKKPQAKKVAPAKAPVKSVEQQRADALAYAKKVFGEHIGEESPPPKPAREAREAHTASGRAAAATTSSGRNPFTAASSHPAPVPATSRGTSAPASESPRVGRKRVSGGGAGSSAVEEDDEDVPKAATSASRKQARYGKGHSPSAGPAQLNGCVGVLWLPPF
jgi:hypothetical protein